MSNTPNVNEALRNAALERAAKQFPEFAPEQVLSSVDKQYQEIMNARPVVQGPMRTLR